MKKTAKTSLMGTASLAVAVAFGTGFHLAYPAVPIDTGLATLFFLAGAVTWAIAYAASRFALRQHGGGFKKKGKIFRPGSIHQKR